MESSVIFMLVSLAVVCQQCYGSEIEERVYNGRDAFPGQFPYQAMLFSFTYANRSWGEYCGGSLISRNFVLTATHCVKDTDATTVFLGVTYSSTRYTNSTRYTVDHKTNVYEHAQYNPKTFENDIALIKLPQEVTLNQYIRTVRLPKLAWANPDTFNKEVVVASGFGQTYNNDPNIPHKVLQYTILVKMPQADCRKAMGNLKVTNGMICTDKSTYSGICPGDSGGPLVVRYKNLNYVIGAVDWIIPPCKNNYPGVFTNVAYYLKWINERTHIPIS